MKSNVKAASATEVKNHFGDYLAQVVYGHEPVYVERHGKPLAVLVGIEEWRAKEKREEPRPVSSWAEACRQLAEQIRRDCPNAKQTPADVLVRQLRDEAE